MNKWISIRTRKPEDSKAVLVWCPQRQNHYCANWTTRGDDAKKRWVVFGDGLSRDLERDQKVTHWMPLPEPPEKS